MKYIFPVFALAAAMTLNAADYYPTNLGAVSSATTTVHGASAHVSLSYQGTSMMVHWSRSSGNDGFSGSVWVQPAAGVNSDILGAPDIAGSGVNSNGFTSGTVVLNGITPGSWFKFAARVNDSGVSATFDTLGYFQAKYVPSRKRLDLHTRGDPVQLATGIESRHRTLFKFTGARNWEFTLDYNSLYALTASNPVEAAPLPMGRGWSHNFQSRFTPAHTDTGTFNSVSRDNFSSAEFAPSAADSNIYVSAADGSVYDKLTINVGVSALLTQHDQTSLLFDADGRLAEDRDAQGHKLVLAYDTDDRLASITDPLSGTYLNLAYDTDGLLSTLTDATGAVVHLAYATIATVGEKGLSQITDANGKHTNFTYDTNGQLLTIVDDVGQTMLSNTVSSSALVSVTAQADGITGRAPAAFSYASLSTTTTATTYTDHNGKQSVHTFDFQYNLVSEQDPLNHTTSYTYDAINQLASVTDPLGRTTSYNRDAQGNILTVTDPAGKVSTCTYDARNNLLTTTDPLGQVTTRTYDSNNNLLTLVDALGRTTTWTYDSNSLPLTMTLLGGGVYHYTYTAGRLTTATDPAGVATNFGYDADGRLLYREDAAGKRVIFTYDAVGNVLTVTNALSQITTYEYDHRNRVKKITDPAGAITQYTYDNNGNLLTSTNALGKVTTYTYDCEDRVKTMVDALSRTITYNYDDAGRLTSVVDPAGNTTAYEYDAAGQLTAVVDASGKRTTTAYDGRGLLTSVTDPLSHVAQFTYDDVGHRITAKDPLNRITQFEYDALNRVKKVTDPGSLVAEQGFDVDGNRTSLKNPANHSTTFVYDATGRLTTTTTPEVHATSYTYNSRGLPATAVEPSTQTTTFAYDDAQRLSSVTDPVGTISLTRDADGRVLTVTEGSKTLTRVYDALGRMTSYTDGDGNAIGYAYDDIGRLTKVTYPGTPLKEVSYAYDTAGRLHTVTDWASRVTTYSYDAVGRMTQLLRPNGTKQTRAYDDAGRLTALQELAPDGVTLIYSGSHSYDAADQLTGETISPAIAPVAVGVTQTFDADNRLLTHNGAATTFDADGNLLAIAAGAAPASYTYDARNRLTAAGGLGYTYDVENRRVALTDSSGTTHYVINPNAVLDQVLIRTAPDGTKTFYVYGLGLLHEEMGSAVRYYHHDRRGDTIALTDGAGGVTDRASYGIYGELLSHIGTTNTPFLFNGQWGVQTDTSGIYYHRARYYHPQLRRFLNQDTGLGGLVTSVTLNRFAYANGDPVNLNDPFGLAAWGMSGAHFFQTLGGIVSGNPMGGAFLGGMLTSFGNNLGLQEGNVFNALNATINPMYLARVHFHEMYNGIGMECDDLGTTLSIGRRIVSGALGVLDTTGAVSGAGWFAGKISPLISAIETAEGAPLMQQLEQQNMAGPNLRMTPDQQVLKELVDEATLGGRKPLTVDQAQTIRAWADEVGYPNVRATPSDVSVPSNWMANPVPHIHFPGVGSGHIPVESGLPPWNP